MVWIFCPFEIVNEIEVRRRPKCDVPNPVHPQTRIHNQNHQLCNTKYHIYSSEHINRIKITTLYWNNVHREPKTLPLSHFDSIFLHNCSVEVYLHSLFFYLYLAHWARVWNYFSNIHILLVDPKPPLCCIPLAD